MPRNVPEILQMIESGWQHLPVLVVGDVMLDQYIWGEVERISPEAPVPVVRTTSHSSRPGGAGNVAMNLAGLGARVTVLGLAGDDPEKDELDSLLVEAGIEPRLTALAASRTTRKLRVLAGNQQMMRIDMENCQQEHSAAGEALLTSALELLPQVSALVLSDYGKGVLSEQLCRYLIEEARRRGVPVVVDPKHRDFLRYRGATTLCPNLKELAAATGEPASDMEAVFAAAQALLSSLEMEFLVVTLGERGIAVLRRTSQHHYPAVVRQVHDVSGAGDTVTSVIALGLACGADIGTATELANAAAGIVVSKVGTSPVHRDELLGAFSDAISAHPAEKVVTMDRLLGRVSGWRSSGERIVFTNGCFDLLHIGHITLLEQARRQGDRLIVALNSDHSARRLKGPSRPLVTSQERARVLASLGVVDAVIVFEQDTPLHLIEAIRPDVLVKGGDYRQENIVGASEVRKWGGRVEIIPLVAGYSSSRLIARTMATARADDGPRDVAM